MTQSANKKYLFETSFEAQDIAYRQSFHSPEALEAAKASAFAQGFQEAQQDFEARNHAQLMRLEEKFTALFDAQEALRGALHHWVSKLCQEAFKNAFPIYAQKARFDEIDDALCVAVAKAKLEKTFALRVAPGEIQGLEEKLTKWHAQGITIHLEEDSALSPTDCQISWSDSGLERMERAIYEEILRTFGSMPAYDTLEMAREEAMQESNDQAPSHQEETTQHIQEGDAP